MNENTRFLIYIERFLPVNENTRFLIYIKRDLYSERKYNVCNIYIERDFYSERKYKIFNIYRKRFLQQTKIQDSLCILRDFYQ